MLPLSLPVLFLILIPNPADDYVITFRLVRERTIRTVLDLFSGRVPEPLRFTGTFRLQIEWAEAEHTVHLFDPLMAGVVFTIFICKKAI